MWMMETEYKENEQRIPASQYKIQLYWTNIIGIIILHLCVPYTLYLGFTTASAWTWMFSKYCFYNNFLD